MLGTLVLAHPCLYRLLCQAAQTLSPFFPWLQDPLEQYGISEEARFQLGVGKLHAQTVAPQD